MTALSSLLNSRGGCLLPIPTCRSSLPDWMVLINCQLDWLQIFIICDDWANLDSNLNQGCWRTAAGRDFSSLQEVHRYCTQSIDFMLHANASKPSQTSALFICWSSRRSRVWKKSLPPSAMAYHKRDFDCFGFLGEILPQLCLPKLAYQHLRSVVLLLTLLRIMEKTAVRNAHHSDDNGLATECGTGMYGWDVTAD